MKRRYRYILVFAFPAVAAYLFRSSPDLSTRWTTNVIRPAAGLLHRISAYAPFPVAELILFLIPCILFIGIIRAACGCFSKRSFAPVAKWFKTLLVLLIFFASAYVLLWYPAYWTADTAPTTPDAEQAVWLCETIISELNHAELNFPPAAEVLESAAEICGIPGAKIKAARYPEWMHLLRISGVYVPWTGEAIVSLYMPETALPFTAVHELMHLHGIADEGAANSAAWAVCKNAGGTFYTSARLWVLKYAMEMVYENNPAATDALYGKMSNALYRAFSGMSGRTPPRGMSGALISALGLTRSISSYPDLVGHVLKDYPYHRFLFQHLPV